MSTSYVGYFDVLHESLGAMWHAIGEMGVAVLALLAGSIQCKEGDG